MRACGTARTSPTVPDQPKPPMGVLYRERRRRGRVFGPRRRRGPRADTPQLDRATPLCVTAPRKSETRSPGEIAASSRSTQDDDGSPSNWAIPCGGCCGFPLGRGGPGGPSPSPPRRGRAMGHTMFSAHELFSERRKGFSELPKVLSENQTFYRRCSAWVYKLLPRFINYGPWFINYARGL